MVTLIKSIKPQRFKDENLRREFRNALRRAGRVIKKDFEGVTKTWEHQPEFKVETHVTKRLPSPSVEVYTKDKIFNYVNMGTGGAKKGTGETYEIWAGAYTGKSDKTALAFPSAFTPKSTPGSLAAGSGSSGGETVLTPYVEHPGIKPRRFDLVIKKERTPWFKRLMEGAMRKAAKASGHSMK